MRVPSPSIQLGAYCLTIFDTFAGASNITIVFTLRAILSSILVS